METITFINCRNFGDVIYSLPFCKSVAKSWGYDKFNYALVINYPANYSKVEMMEGSTHPCGNVTMTESIANMICPILEKQNYINDIIIIDYTKTPKLSISRSVRLEKVNKLPLNLSKGSITRWYSNLCDATAPIDDFHEWIRVKEKQNDYKNKIVLVRSQRYWGKLNYFFLQKYIDNIVFIGTDSEYESITNAVGVAPRHIIINNFYEASVVINSAKLVIGNQTGLFSLAEAMKVPRILEQSINCPNVIPNGAGGFAAVTQAYFEKMVENLYK